MQPLPDRVELRAMAMKWYSAFPKDLALLKPHHQNVSYHIQVIHWAGRFLLLYRDAVGLFYSPHMTGQAFVWFNGISTIVGHLIFFYSYVLNIWFLNIFLKVTFLNKPELFLIFKKKSFAYNKMVSLNLKPFSLALVQSFVYAVIDLNKGVGKYIPVVWESMWCSN